HAAVDVGRRSDVEEDQTHEVVRDERGVGEVDAPLRVRLDADPELVPDRRLGVADDRPVEARRRSLAADVDADLGALGDGAGRRGHRTAGLYVEPVAEVAAL